MLPDASRDLDEGHDPWPAAPQPGAKAEAVITEIGLPVGYRGWMLPEYLRDHRYGMRIRCLLNSDYKWGNGSSVYLPRTRGR